MNKLDYTDHLKNILAYDNIINTLSIASRYWLHREVIANSTNVIDEAIVTEANENVLTLSNQIKDTKWQRPELRYNCDRVLQVHDDEACIWRQFKPEDYV